MSRSSSLLDQLKEVFLAEHVDHRHGAQPVEKVGIELELFPVVGQSGGSSSPEDMAQVLPYFGKRSISQFLKVLSEVRGWECELERGNVVGLKRAQELITLEPSGVIEYVSPPLESLESLQSQLKNSLEEVRSAAREVGVSFFATGYHPFYTEGELALVPKTRYQHMYEYMPSVGRRGREMMKLMASLHVSLDYPSRGEAMSTLCLLSKLTPLLVALTANSAYRKGRLSGFESQRVAIWENTDPARSGMPSFVFNPAGDLEDYLDWALDAPVYFLRRGDNFCPIFDTSFRELSTSERRIFAGDGETQIFLSIEDWKRHLGTLFPWVRLKNYLEARAFDGLGPKMSMACTCLLTSLFYDPEKRQILHDEFGSLTEEETMSLLSKAGVSGLADDEVWIATKKLLTIASQSPSDEEIHKWFSQSLLDVLWVRVEERFVPSSLSLNDTVLHNLI